MIYLYYISLVLTMIFSYLAFGIFIYGYLKKQHLFVKRVPLFIILIIFCFITMIIWGITRNYVRPFWAN